LASTAARLPKASSTSRQCALRQSAPLRPNRALCPIVAAAHHANWPDWSIGTLSRSTHPFTLELCAAGAHCRYSLPLSCACIDALPPALTHGIDAGSSARMLRVIRALLSEPTMRAARHSLSQPSRKSQSVERPPPSPLAVQPIGACPIRMLLRPINALAGCQHNTVVVPSGAFFSLVTACSDPRTRRLHIHSFFSRRRRQACSARTVSTAYPAQADSCEQTTHEWNDGSRVRLAAERLPRHTTGRWRARHVVRLR